MKTIYQIFLVLLIASFVLFMFASCTSKYASNPNQLHGGSENDDANTAIILNKQIIAKLDTAIVIENESWTNEEDDDDDDDDDQ